MTDITKVTQRFGRAYERNKKAKTWLEKQQRALFRAFDQDLANRTASQRSIEIPEGEDSETYIKVHHPGWQIVGWSADHTHAILEETPSLLAHRFINHEDGMVYGRAQVTGSPSLDDDRLRAEDPELWERITEWPEPWWSLVFNVFVKLTQRWSDDTLKRAVSTYLKEQNVQRVLKDLNTLSTHDLTLIEPYILPGPISVKLIPPRKAKPEELTDE